jgi:hypothetical protein
MRRVLDLISVLQPTIFGLLPLVSVALLMSGCTTAGGDSAGRTRSFATTATTTAAGAYIGSKEGDGKAKSAALGAAVGFVAGEVVNYFSNAAQKEAFLSGYEKGQSNAVKQQYWIARANHRPMADDGYEEGYYEFPVPANEREGVRREPSTRVVRIVMPKQEVSP